MTKFFSSKSLIFSLFFLTSYFILSGSHALQVLEKHPQKIKLGIDVLLEQKTDLVKGKKVQHNKEDILILTEITQNSEGEFVATFDYEGHQFTVRAGEKLLGRTVRKITAEKNE